MNYLIDVVLDNFSIPETGELIHRICQFLPNGYKSTEIKFFLSSKFCEMYLAQVRKSGGVSNNIKLLKDEYQEEFKNLDPNEPKAADSISSKLDEMECMPFILNMCTDVVEQISKHEEHPYLSSVSFN